MEELQLIVHRVARGMAVSLIEKPGDYLTHINLGAGPGYSPLEQLYAKRHLTCDLLIITHPHPDHLADLTAASSDFLRPAALQYVDYDLDKVMATADGADRRLIEQFREFSRAVPRGDYRGEGTCWWKHWKPDFAAESFGKDKVADNSGLFVVFTWRNFKIAVTADQEAEAIDLLLDDPETRAMAYKTDILVVPRHGDSSGFSRKWPEVLGKPYVTVVSGCPGRAVSPGYDSTDYSRGVLINDRMRYCLDTAKDGSIAVRMNYTGEGKPAWAFSFE